MVECYIEQATQWAMDKLGSTVYPFLCLAFCEDAYELSNRIVLDGYSYAREAASGYGLSHSGIPPSGSLVFYDCWGILEGTYRNWGHVGLAVGNGKVVHAWDKVRLNDYLEVQELEPADGWTKPAYIGWASVEALLKGMRPRSDGESKKGVYEF